jgi:hypothetical protein
MFAFNTTLIACAFAACTLMPSVAAAQKPYEFRGLPLGISIDAFRSHEAARATPAGSVAICETDSEAAALGMSLRCLARPGAPPPRLYRMSFVVDAAVFADLTDALTSKYGASRIEREHGASKRVWENASSSITLDTNGVATAGRVIYRLKDHEAYLCDVMNRWRSATASLSAP